MEHGLRFFGRSHFSHEDLRHYISYRVAWVLSSTGFVYTAYFFIIKNLFLAVPGLVISMSLALSTYAIQKKKLEPFSKFWLVLCANLAVFYYSAILGKPSGIYFFFFATSTLSFVLFSLKERIQIILGISLSVLGFIFSNNELFSSYFIVQHVSPSVQRTLEFMTGIGSFVIVCIALGAYSYATETTFFKLFTAFEVIQKSNANLETMNKEKEIALSEQIRLNNQLQTEMGIRQEFFVQLEKRAIELEEGRRLLKQNQEANEKLVAQSAYANICRNIAHEIRTPITLLMSNSELIQHNLSDKDAILRFSKKMMSAMIRLNNLTKAMLDYGEGVSDNPDTFKIEDLLKDIVELAQPRCNQLRLQVLTDYSHTKTVFASKKFIYQALLNLVSNAIQHTPPGGTLTLKTCDTFIESEYPIPGVEVRVIDTGKGISKENMNKIFQPYFSTTDVEDEYHVGLGLAFTQRVIVENRGTISVESTLGQGCTFIVQIPSKADNLL